MFTRKQGSDAGNAVAITIGLATTTLLGGNGMVWSIDWLPKVTFTWFAMIGATVVFAFGVIFQTPDDTLERATKQVEEAREREDVPLALRLEVNGGDGEVR